MKKETIHVDCHMKLWKNDGENGYDLNLDSVIISYIREAIGLVTLSTEIYCAWQNNHDKVQQVTK